MPTLQAAAGESGNNKPMVCTKEPLLLESNQNHATVQTDGISTALPASMGEGGGYVPMVLNDQGGSQMSVSEDVSGTLRAQEHGHQPLVVQGADMYNQEITGDIAATLSANSCMTATRSGPSVIEQTFSLQGGGATSQNAQGLGVNEDVSFTLNGVDRHAVAYGVDHVITTGGNCTAEGPCVYEEKEATLKASGVHAVAYRKTAHPKTVDEPQGWEQTDTNDTLNAFDQGEQRTPTIVLENHPADSRVKISEDGVFQALTSRMGTGGGNVPMVMEDNVTASKASYFMKTDSEDRAQTLVATDYKDPQIVAYDARNGNESEVNGALQSSSCHNVNSNNTCRVNSIVRRLTPKECERLQGFPDGWTDIGDWTDSKGKKHKGDSDSPRYKALGNSIALPFWRWMARRMVAVLKRDGCEYPTMASLFDGIGGFPLVYSECGCEPIWASEIEEFPIAVTKLRFPEE
jgi:DNA (cytosine-5)-methyltransferase 1